MSKAVMISIQPKWCKLIANGKKTIEVRKTKPNVDVPFKCYIYATAGKGLYMPYEYDCFPECEESQIYTATKPLIDIDIQLNGKVIGEFVCDKVEEIEPYEFFTGEDYDLIYEDEILRKSCLTDTELEDYLYSKDGKGYAWHITELKIYYEPKELREFQCIKIYYCNAKYGETCFSGCKYIDFYKCKNSITRPFQSWGYCEELKDETHTI